MTRILAREDEIVEEEPESTSEQMIGAVRARDRVHLTGTIESVIATQTGWQADLSDGSGHLTLIWMGRTPIRGIHIGTTMHVWGRVAAKGADLVIYNPGYAIQAS